MTAPAGGQALPERAGRLTFKAAGLPAADLAEVIAHKWGVSVLISADKGGTQIHGVLQEATLRDALDALAYWCGTRWRIEGGLIYVGGGSVETVVAVPRGLLQDELKSSFGQEVTSVGDKIVVKGDAEKVAQITRALEALGDVSTRRVRLYAALMTERQVHAVNRWLSAIEAGGQAALGASQASLESELTQNASWGAAASIDALLELVDDGATSSVVSDLQLTLVSGRKIMVESGEVDEREIRTDVATGGGNNNQASFRTGFDRRTIGLSVEIDAAEIEGRWFLHTIVKDSAMTDGRERTVSVDGYHWLEDGPVKIAELTRKDSETGRQTFDLLPFLKKRQTTDEERRLVILAEPFVPRAEAVQEAREPAKPSRWPKWLRLGVKGPSAP